MALFTSYAQLRATSKVIAPLLLRDGIIVYEQGDGVSRRAMLDQFRGAERAVILGTRSFWEGVDIQGEKLSALAICKLPFDVPTDPIFAARSETFENSFSDYSVPESVLKFRHEYITIRHITYTCMDNRHACLTCGELLKCRLECLE